jgi:hypothetical protein
MVIGRGRRREHLIYENPIAVYELALIIICPFYFHNYISIMVFGYVV